jgi:hypothetical protein
MVPYRFNISQRHIGRMSRQLQDVRGKYTTAGAITKSELETHAARIALEDQTDSMGIYSSGTRCYGSAQNCPANSLINPMRGNGSNRVNDFDTSRTFGIDSDHAFIPLSIPQGELCTTNQACCRLRVGKDASTYYSTTYEQGLESSISRCSASNGDQRDDEATN